MSFADKLVGDDKELGRFLELEHINDLSSAKREVLVNALVVVFTNSGKLGTLSSYAATNACVHSASPSYIVALHNVHNQCLAACFRASVPTVWLKGAIGDVIKEIYASDSIDPKQTTERIIQGLASKGGVFPMCSAQLLQVLDKRLESTFGAHGTTVSKFVLTQISSMVLQPSWYQSAAPPAQTQRALISVAKTLQKLGSNEAFERDAAQIEFATLNSDIVQVFLEGVLASNPGDVSVPNKEGTKLTSESSSLLSRLFSKVSGFELNDMLGRDGKALDAFSSVLAPPDCAGAAAALTEFFQSERKESVLLNWAAGKGDFESRNLQSILLGNFLSTVCGDFVSLVVTGALGESSPEAMAQSVVDEVCTRETEVAGPFKQCLYRANSAVSLDACAALVFSLLCGGALRDPQGFGVSVPPSCNQESRDKAAHLLQGLFVSQLDAFSARCIPLFHEFSGRAMLGAGGDSLEPNGVSSSDLKSAVEVLKSLETQESAMQMKSPRRERGLSGSRTSTRDRGGSGSRERGMSGSSSSIPQSKSPRGKKFGATIGRMFGRKKRGKVQQEPENVASIPSPVFKKTTNAAASPEMQKEVEKLRRESRAPPSEQPKQPEQKQPAEQEKPPQLPELPEEEDEPQTETVNMEDDLAALEESMAALAGLETAPADPQPAAVEEAALVEPEAQPEVAMPSKPVPEEPQPEQEPQLDYALDGVNLDALDALAVWEVGDTVMAQWNEDEQWYTAEVKEVLPGPTYRVVFTEYGNEDVCSAEQLVALQKPVQENKRLSMGFMSGLEAEMMQQFGAAEHPDGFADMLDDIADGNQVSNVDFSIDVLNSSQPEPPAKPSKPIPEPEPEPEGPDPVEAARIAAEAKAAQDKAAKAKAAEDKAAAEAKAAEDKAAAEAKAAQDKAAAEEKAAKEAKLAAETKAAEEAEAGEKAKAAKESETKPEFVMGERCMALFEEDGEWYSAKVVQVDAALNQYLVLFPEYENEQVCTAEQMRKKIAWKLHQECEACWTDDLQWYLARVAAIRTEDDVMMYTVEFLEYGNMQECTEDYLRPLPGQIPDAAAEAVEPKPAVEKPDPEPEPEPVVVEPPAPVVEETGLEGLENLEDDLAMLDMLNFDDEPKTENVAKEPIAEEVVPETQPEPEPDVDEPPVEPEASPDDAELDEPEPVEEPEVVEADEGDEDPEIEEFFKENGLSEVYPLFEERSMTYLTLKMSEISDLVQAGIPRKVARNVNRAVLLRSPKASSLALKKDWQQIDSEAQAIVAEVDERREKQDAQTQKISGALARAKARAAEIKARALNRSSGDLPAATESSAGTTSPSSAPKKPPKKPNKPAESASAVEDPAKARRNAILEKARAARRAREGPTEEEPEAEPEPMEPKSRAQLILEKARAARAARDQKDSTRSASPVNTAECSPKASPKTKRAEPASDYPPKARSRKSLILEKARAARARKNGVEPEEDEEEEEAPVKRSRKSLILEKARATRLAAAQAASSGSAAEEDSGGPRSPRTGKSPPVSPRSRNLTRMSNRPPPSLPKKKKRLSRAMPVGAGRGKSLPTPNEKRKMPENQDNAEPQPEEEEEPEAVADENVDEPEVQDDADGDSGADIEIEPEPEPEPEPESESESEPEVEVEESEPENEPEPEEIEPENEPEPEESEPENEPEPEESEPENEPEPEESEEDDIVLEPNPESPPAAEATLFCDQCGHKNDASLEACESCGERLMTHEEIAEIASLFCDNCGHKNDSSLADCESCGEHLTTPEEIAEIAALEAAEAAEESSLVEEVEEEQPAVSLTRARPKRPGKSTIRGPSRRPPTRATLRNRSANEEFMEMPEELSSEEEEKEPARKAFVPPKGGNPMMAMLAAEAKKKADARRSAPEKQGPPKGGNPMMAVLAAEAKKKADARRSAPEKQEKKETPDPPARTSGRPAGRGRGRGNGAPSPGAGSSAARMAAVAKARARVAANKKK